MTVGSSQRWMLLLFPLLGTACRDLDVTGPHDLERLRALTPEQVTSLADSSVNQWWLASTHYEPYTMLEGTADALTGNCCWVRFNNTEPRLPYANQANGGDEQIALRPWQLNYAAIASAVDALGALEVGVVIPGDAAEAERVRAAALWTLAAAHMNLALLFDSAFVVTTPGQTATKLQGYRAVRDSSLALWDELIALTNGKSWQWDAATLPLAAGPASAATINRLARTMAARTLVLSARTPEQNTSTNWSRVLAYADRGITGSGLADMDFAVAHDDVRWYNYFQMYAAYHDRFRVDQRLISRMASNIPATFNGLTEQPLPEPEDDRLAIANLPCSATDPLPCTAGITADYVYVGNVVGDPFRGIYMQSPFWHRRYVLTSWAYQSPARIGKPSVHVLAAENDLMIAEALARTGGNLTRAAALVNKTHVGRGGRTPVGSTFLGILEGVEYERDVELLNSGGIALFDRRRTDRIQPGTLRHLPVPARERELLGKPVYTYGGIGKPDM